MAGGGANPLRLKIKVGGASPGSASPAPAGLPSSSSAARPSAPAQPAPSSQVGCLNVDAGVLEFHVCSCWGSQLSQPMVQVGAASSSQAAPPGETPEQRAERKRLAKAAKEERKKVGVVHRHGCHFESNACEGILRGCRLGAA